MNRRTFAVVALIAFLGACSTDEPPVRIAEQLPAGTGLMLLFQDLEPGVEPYVTRVLITGQYLRMDDGEDNSDYVLLDRNAETVYSVNHEMANVLVVPARPVKVQPPVPLQYDSKQVEDPNAPSVAGERPQRFTLSVNGQVCKDVIVVPGLLPEAVAALTQFRTALAGQHAQNLHKTPADQFDPCFLAHHVFAPLRDLEHGFPIHEWDNQGMTRSLISFEREYAIDPALFTVPTDYPKQEMGIDPGART